jgi:acyl carrier protein
MINSFEKELSAVNWQPHVIRPAYGLSETTMGVSYTPTGVPFKVDYLIGNEFGIGKKVRCYDKKQDKKGIERVSVGVLDECNDVEIRDYENNTLPEETIGLINIRGSNVMKGYFNLDNIGVIDNDGWFNTGDLGYFHKGWLTVLGREKNVIIFNGKNYLVTDLELTGKKHLSPKDTIVLIQGYTVNKQKTCILFGEGLSKNQLLVSARDIMDEWGIKISFVVALNQITRTSSGKINRIQLSTDWEQKTYDDIVIKVKSEEQSKGKIDPRLIGIWAEILAIEPSGIGKDSHFITDLGGDSLGVIDMTCEVEEVYSLSIPETEVENLLVLEAMNDFIQKKIS